MPLSHIPLPVIAQTGAGATLEGLIPTDIWGAFEAGGALMWPILGCSVVALAFAVERLVMLRRSRVIPPAFVDTFLQQLRAGTLDKEKALGMCRSEPSAVAKVCFHAVRKWGRPSQEIERAIVEGGERELDVLRRNTRVLSIASSIAPLLGLLGTVTGMIAAFNSVGTGPGKGNLSGLASGISEALLTTAFGLLVSIPCLITYYYLTSRIERLVQDMGAIADDVVDCIANDAAGDGVAATGSIPAPSRRSAKPPKHAIEA